MKAGTRLLADEKYDSGYVNNDKNFNWQREMDEGYHGKPRTPGRVLPPDTFTKSSSEIAHALKQHSETYQQAMSKLTSYINRQGRNLQGSDKSRLSQAKDALRQAYGEPDEGTKTESSSELPIFSLKPGHNLDDGYLKTGLDEVYEQAPTEEVKDEAVPLNAAGRLLGE